MIKVISPVPVLVFSSVLWGLSWLPLKFLNSTGIEGVPLLFVSQLLLGLGFLLKGWRTGVVVNNWRPLLGITFAGGAAILCFTSALIYGDVIRVMVLFYLLPVWGVLGGKFFLGEHPDGVRWLGVVLALFGAFLILGGVAVFDAPPSWYDLLALASGLFFAANNMLFRGVEKIALTTKLMAMFMGCASLSGALLLAGWQAWPQEVSDNGWFWLLLYTVTWLLAANLGSQWAVTRMEAGRSSIIIIMELVAAVLSALMIAGERLDAWEWAGCLMVVTAAVLEALRSEDAELAPVSGELPTS